MCAEVADCQRRDGSQLQDPGDATPETIGHGVTPPGGQAILTLRSLIQSERWPAASELLRADFCQTVIIHETPSAPPTMTLHEPALAPIRKTLEPRLCRTALGL